MLFKMVNKRMISKIQSSQRGKEPLMMSDEKICCKNTFFD